MTVMVVEPVEEKGFVFRYVDMGSLTQMDNALLSCFYPNQMQDIFVPQFICAANGNSILVSSPSGAKTKVQQFAEDCRAAA